MCQHLTGLVCITVEILTIYDGTFLRWGCNFGKILKTPPFTMLNFIFVSSVTNHGQNSKRKIQNLK